MAPWCVRRCMGARPTEKLLPVRNVFNGAIEKKYLAQRLTHALESHTAAWQGDRVTRYWWRRRRPDAVPARLLFHRRCDFRHRHRRHPLVGPTEWGATGPWPAVTTSWAAQSGGSIRGAPDADREYVGLRLPRPRQTWSRAAPSLAAPLPALSQRQGHPPGGQQPCAPSPPPPLRGDDRPAAPSRRVRHDRPRGDAGAPRQTPALR